MNKNRNLNTLNNTLFAQLERLDDEDLTKSALTKEIHRSKAMIGVSQGIINNAKIQLDAVKYRNDLQLDDKEQLPTVFAIEVDNKEQLPTVLAIEVDNA